MENLEFKTSSGIQKGDFCYIDDVQAINLTLLSNKSNGKVYNIGSGKPVKIRNVVKLLNL